MIANRGRAVPLATMAWPPDQPFRRGGEGLDPVDAEEQGAVRDRSGCVPDGLRRLRSGWELADCQRCDGGITHPTTQAVMS